MTIEPAATSVSPAHLDLAYVDANVIVRYLTDDPPDMAKQALVLFAVAQRGGVRLLVTTVTLAEVVWTLASFYQFDRGRIAEKLTALVTATGLEMEDRDEATLALSLYAEKNVNFADALLAARSLLVGPTEIYSFDRHFDRLTGIRRRTPGGDSLRSNHENCR